MKIKNLIYVSAWLAITVGLPAGLCAQGQSEEHAHADGKGNRTLQAPPRSGTTGQVLTGNGINYNGGSVLKNGTNVYYIWYGNWSQDATANAILTDLASNIGGSPYFAINTSYADTVGSVQNRVTYLGATADSGSLGTSLTDANIWTLVNNALTSKALPVDPNGVYFVLTAPYVAETSGFLSSYCGWHTYGYFGSTPINYAFIGNPAANMGACSIQSAGPNGDAEADAMASVISHELEEATTDPQLSAWYDSLGNENADKCAWTFGTTYAANGAKANMLLGSRNYLIQQNWVNADGGSCALSYVPSPDFSLAVSPASQSVLAGATTGSYTIAPVSINGWSGTVTYSVTAGLPAGATAYVAGNAITIATTTGVLAGTYSFTIQGTDGTRTHTVGATLVVSAADFSLSVSPTSQTVMPGGKTGNYTLKATALSGWSGTVTYVVTAGLPSGAAALVSGSTITVSTAIGVAPGSYNFTIQGTDGFRTHATTATLVVSSPTFSIAVGGSSSGNVSRPTGTATASATYQVTVSSIGGFSGAVNLTASGATTGIALKLSAASVAAGGTATLTATVTASAKKGNQTLTVVGVSGSITQSATATLKVN